VRELDVVILIPNAATLNAIATITLSGRDRMQFANEWQERFQILDDEMVMVGQHCPGMERDFVFFGG
jgi:hypothetical protein